jgi:acyl-coenzyme A thioesterase PaaI-like protein
VSISEDEAGIRALIESGSPFARTLAPHVISIGGGEVDIEATVPPTLNNHMGGPHAAALFGLAETAAAGIVVSVFEDLVGIGAIPMVKSAEIVYTQVAYGHVSAHATFTGDEAGVRSSYAQRGVAVFPVEVTIANADGAETARMRAQMALKRF